MTDKDFANMPIEKLKEYCKDLQRELDIARWFLRNKSMSKVKPTPEEKNTPVL